MTLEKMLALVSLRAGEGCIRTSPNRGKSGKSWQIHSTLFAAIAWCTRPCNNGGYDNALVGLSLRTSPLQSVCYVRGFSYQVAEIPSQCLSSLYVQSAWFTIFSSVRKDPCVKLITHKDPCVKLISLLSLRGIMLKDDSKQNKKSIEIRPN